ncbi:ubiquitin carboxyl-terminal hydrolase 19 isoform X4 [Lates japonicus]|uniref:ubiquitinyl hydrolase 1 n=1 Tax=Lates japonicus TaxID=270547 RepID=A0AAD3M160_LATJO|nr:ubiquitin carboxyl-terminal hydrolase 19 isoform X4 [Lates japonicus]
MASSGGSETVGRRGGAQQRGGSGRDSSSDLSSSTSKKKQKDRANQESREAKRAAAAAAAAVDGVIAEVKKDVFVDWKQNVNEVTVRLRCGEGVQRIEDISTNFTDTHCHVCFPDGRQWSCQLQEEIEASCSRVQYKEKGGFLHLIMHKKIPFHIWPSLKSNKKEKEKEAAPTETKNDKEPEIKHAASEPLEKPKLSSPQPQPPSSPAHSESRRSSGKAERGVKRCLKNKPACDKATVDTVGVKGGAGDGSAPTNKPVTVTGGEQQPQEPSAKRTIVRLPKTTKEATSPADKDTHSVKSNGKALHTHLPAGRSPQTQRRDGDNRAERLGSGQEQKPGVAVAAASHTNKTQVAVPSSPACMEKSQPGSSQHSLPAKEEPPRVGEEKPKAPKASSRVDDGGLDTVAPRTVSEHVAITKPEPTVTTPKPTCMVQPMTHAPPATNERHEEEEEKKVCLPGFTGLVNLGNTCFMNSVIQSLSNTRELRDYFHDRAFEAEINCNNPLGTGGRLAIGFAVLLRALWKGTHHAFQPSKLKAIVASKASQFTGYAQHDAQEFMAFLLDGLHEDLNRIQNKPYTETVDSDGRLDEVVAEEAWQRHKMRNDSFIVDLFQGQFKSKLVCPTCSKVSITFDPFLYLPVPLPQKQKVLSVFYFAKEPHKKPIKFLVSVSKENSSTAEVLESISRSVRVKPENLRLAEVGKSRFQRMFLPSHSLDTVSSSDMLFCFEVLSKDLAKERVVLLRVQQKLQVPSIPISKCAACLKPPVSEEDKLKRCTRCYRVGYCNQVCQRTHWPNHKGLCRPNAENVGLPFLVSVAESRLSYTRLTQLLEGYSRFSVNVFQPPFQSGRTSPETSQCRVDLPPMPAGTPEGTGSGDEAVGGSSTVEAGDQELESQSLLPESQAEYAQASAFHSAESDSLSQTSLSTTRTTDSGFSEPVSTTSCCSLDPHAEKETSCEKAVRPEAAVTGYQHPSESASGHVCQFYISLLDSNNKEQRLDEREDLLADLPEDVTLELVWKNNERLKEYVLVSSKELEYEEDPGSLSETARAGHFTLEQCLNLFTKPEVLAPEEAWYCPKCQQHREASKQLLLWRLPNVLIIQLKRFSFRSFIWRDKINDMVDFPVRNLDLSKFCIGQKDEMQQPPIYDLYAVINHYGGMIGGHYTAYARLPSDKNSQRSDVGWRLFDDSTVTMVEESQVVTRYAYVLFYRRRNSPVERPPRFLRPMGAESPSAAGATASQASSQSLFGTDLDAEGPPTLTPEVPSDLFTHSGECTAPSYSNMEEVD